MNNERPTIIGPSSGIQVSLLVIVISACVGGGIFVGTTRAELDTLKNLMYDVRNEVRDLTRQVHRIPEQH